MTSHNLNIATLTWLDRRQLWATTNRPSSLGVSTVPVYPSMLGGQGSRPNVAHRHFAPSLTWFVNVAVVASGLALALVLTLFALRGFFSLALKKLTLTFDRALAANAEGLRQGTVLASPLHNLEPQSPSTRFAKLIYSLVGSLDSSSYVPAYKSGDLLATPSWEASFLALPLNGWASKLVTQGTPAPSFRSYLGEWRRLVDQTSVSLNPQSPQGYIQTSRSRFAPSSLKTPTNVGSLGNVNGSSSHTPINNAYSLYLSTPWVF